MKPFSSITECYKRWRHSRGYGVHSPFAYDIVKNVVSPGHYAYYAYKDIDRALLVPGASVSNHLRHDARLLLRLLVFLASGELIIYPVKQPVMRCVAKAAGVKCKDMNKANLAAARKTSLILVRKNISFHIELAKAINAGAAVLALDPVKPLRDLIAATMTDGLILEGKRIMIAIPRQQMVLTSYSMKF